MPPPLSLSAFLTAPLLRPDPGQKWRWLPLFGGRAEVGLGVASKAGQGAAQEPPSCSVLQVLRSHHQPHLWLVPGPGLTSHLRSPPSSRCQTTSSCPCVAALSLPDAQGFKVGAPPLAILLTAPHLPPARPARVDRSGHTPVVSLLPGLQRTPTHTLQSLLLCLLLGLTEAIACPDFLKLIC